MFYKTHILQKICKKVLLSFLIECKIFSTCTVTYQILVFSQNVKWILAQSESEIVFDHACDLGFHSSALLNGPGALGAREEHVAECS